MRPTGSAVWTSSPDLGNPELRWDPASLAAGGSAASAMTPRPRRWPSTTPCCDGSRAMGGPSSPWGSAGVNRRTRQRSSTGLRC